MPSSSRLALSPRRYRTITLWAIIALATIVVTGAAVRLTGSGLGCTDWPNCTENQLVAPLEAHAMVEFINRLFTGVVSAAVIAAVLGSLARTPRRRDLTWLSLGLVAGVVAQIVLGGITVLVDLHPLAVSGHFVVSMVLIYNAVVLHDRAAVPDTIIANRTDTCANTDIVRQSTGLGTLFFIAMLTGPLVTGSGPHAGDELAPRFGFALASVARVHSLSMWVFLATLMWLGVKWHQSGSANEILGTYSTILIATVAQGAVGYIQYYSGVPALPVALHITLATLIWALLVHLLMIARWPGISSGVTPDPHTTSDPSNAKPTNQASPDAKSEREFVHE